MSEMYESNMCIAGNCFEIGVSAVLVPSGHGDDRVMT